MRFRTIPIPVLLCLAFGAQAHSRPVVESATAMVVTVEAATAALSALEEGWVAEKDDNICGIKDLKKVSNPAVVDYDQLWDATPQIKKLKDENIDPDSAEGKALRNQAKTLITKKSEKVREAEGHCGIWKKIEHTDGREIPDVTEEVLEKINE